MMDLGETQAKQRWNRKEKVHMPVELFNVGNDLVKGELLVMVCVSLLEQHINRIIYCPRVDELDQARHLFLVKLPIFVFVDFVECSYPILNIELVQIKTLHSSHHFLFRYGAIPILIHFV